MAINSVNGNTLLESGFFPPCRAATTGANIVLSGLQTIDGVALIGGDRVLVKDQTDATLNGIYAASTGNWVRTTDARSTTQFFDGMCVVVAQGSVNGQVIYLCTTADDPVIIGTSLLTFALLTRLTPAAANSIRGNNTGAVANAIDLTIAQVRAMLGGWYNVLLAKSAAYVVLNTDRGSSIALGGNAFYQLTFNAASGYDATFAALVTNTDTTRGKTIACSGLASFILRPGQSCLVFNQNNVWTVPPIPRWDAPGGTIIYVDGNIGNDLNDGLATGAGGAFATSAAAMSTIAKSFNVLGALKIKWAAGTYADLGFQAQNYQGPGAISLEGDTVTPANVVMSVPTGTGPVSNGNIFTFQAVGGTWDVQGFKFTSAQNGYQGIAAVDGSLVTFANCEFAVMLGGNHITAFRHGRIDNTGGYTISNGAASHIACGDGGSCHVRTGTILITGTPAFTLAFLFSYAGGTLGTLGGIYSGSATGQRYIAQILGYIDTASTSTTIPGNSPGTPAINTLGTSGGYVT